MVEEEFEPRSASSRAPIPEHHILLSLLFCSSTRMNFLNVASVLYFSLYTLHLTQWLKHLDWWIGISVEALCEKLLGYRLSVIFYVCRGCLNLGNTWFMKSSIGQDWQMAYKRQPNTTPFPIQHQGVAWQSPGGMGSRNFPFWCTWSEGRREGEVK